MEKKSFPIRAVMTCASKYAFVEASGPLWINEFFDQLLPICAFMTQSSIWNHDVPRITDEIAPYILEQHPWMNDVNARLEAIEDAEKRSEEIAKIIAEVEAQHGEEVELFPMHPEDHQQIDDPEESFEANFGVKPNFIEIDEDEGDEPSTYGDINW